MTCSHSHCLEVRPQDQSLLPLLDQPALLMAFPVDSRRPGFLSLEIRHFSCYLNLDTCWTQLHQRHVVGLSSQPHPRGWLWVSIQAGDVTMGQGDHIERGGLIPKSALYKNNSIKRDAWCLSSFYNPMQAMPFILAGIICWLRLYSYTLQLEFTGHTYIAQDSKIYTAFKVSSALK